MAKLDGGQLVVKALQREGVKYIFSLSGGHLLRIYNATIDAGIRIIDTRHEQAAGHMAEGWSLSTGEMGVCAVTAGPGLTDAVTAVANAKMSNSPMLVLGGRSALFESDIGALQDLDQMSLMTPITKWAGKCHQTKRIPEYISMAYRHALSGRPGPAYLELPFDILSQQVEESEVVFPENYRPKYRAAGQPARHRPGLWMSGSRLALRARREAGQSGSNRHPAFRGWDLWFERHGVRHGCATWDTGCVRHR